MTASVTNGRAGGVALGARPARFADLPGTDGKRYSLESFDAARVLVVIFDANRCPTAKAFEERMKAIQTDYRSRGVQLVAVNSTDPHLYAEESFDTMVERARDSSFNFPYLKDEHQAAARAFGAECTLHAFVLDRDRRLRYRGRIEDSRNPDKATSRDVRDALDDLLAGREVRTPETEAFGCALDLG